MNQGTTKTTFVPLQYTDWDLSKHLPIHFSPSVSVEDVSGVLTEQHFELWHEYISRNERKDLASMKVALVNRFASTEHLGAAEEDSHELLYRYFIFIRIIRPTKTRFSAVQFTTSPTGEIDVFRISHSSSSPINVPPTQLINPLYFDDLVQAKTLAQPFIQLAEQGPNHLRRAVRFLEEGYSGVRDPVLQLVGWAMGIEAACASEERSLSQKELLTRIGSYVKPETDFQRIPGIILELPSDARQ